MAWRGAARPGTAGQGKARALRGNGGGYCESSRLGNVWLGVARQGKARTLFELVARDCYGKVWSGRAGHGKAWRGMARIYFTFNRRL